MNVRLVSLLCSLFILLLCTSTGHAYEITDSVAKARLFKRLDARYYNLRDRRFVIADCDVRSSIMDDIDTLLRNWGSGRNPALRAFRAMKTSLHFELLVPATVETKGSVRTNDKQLDSVISHMLGWSEKQLIQAIGAWRMNNISWSDGTSGSAYRVFSEGKGYRIQSIVPGSGHMGEFLFDSALTITKMNILQGIHPGASFPSSVRLAKGLSFRGLTSPSRD